ncbi:MAG: hypothetical protein GY810_00940 [Aureispira sp.]|nr:hypothetical protein [Aureispira sp.]
MPILGNCTLHFPVPDDQGQAKALIAEVDAYTLKQQEIGDAKGSHMYNIEEPE